MAVADRMPVFDDHQPYAIRSFEEGRVWVDQGKVTFLCGLSPVQGPTAVVLRNCHPLITTTRHQTFAVAHEATDKVRGKVAAAEADSADEADTRSHIEEEIADLESFAAAVQQLDDPALAERMLIYSKDLASLSGHACVLEPAEMSPANAINAGQLLFLEFGVVTSPSDAVTIPMGMELEVRSYLDQLRTLALTTMGHDASVVRIDALATNMRTARQRLRAASEQLLHDGRHGYVGRSIHIRDCS